MRDKVLSSVGAKEGLDTSGYQGFADLDDVEFFWENDQLVIDAVFRPGIRTPFFHRQRLTTWRSEVHQETQFCSAKRKT